MGPDYYAYPDKNDAITYNVLIKRFGEYRWTLEEKIVLERVKNSLGKRVDVSLDAGTGEGRLIPFLLEVSKKVIGLDPDQGRLEVAIETFGKHENVFLFRGRASRMDMIPTGSIDFVNFSHVAQHVPSFELLSTMGEFQRIMKKNSFLLLLTTHSESKEKFVVMSADKSEEVSREEFDSLALNPLPERLPIRMFDMAKLKELLRVCGFEIVWEMYYHIKPEFARIDGEESQALEFEMRVRENLLEINRGENPLEKARDVALLLKKAE